MPLTPADFLERTLEHAEGIESFCTGGLVSALEYGIPYDLEKGDIDLFVPTQGALFSMIQRLLDLGYAPDQKYARVWNRWQRFGIGKWHTNSMKLYSMEGYEVNVIYKLVGGHPINTFPQVIEVFDFNFLSVVYHIHRKGVQYHDGREFLNPGMDKNNAGLNPLRRDDWTDGFFSEHQGLRQGPRCGKFALRGHGVDLACEQLVEGYRQAAIYYEDHYKVEKRAFSTVYLAMADDLEAHDWESLVTAYEILDSDNPLPALLESLE